MSHQTGIRANGKLKEVFGKCREGSVRAVKVSIVNEQLELAKSVVNLQDYTWDHSFDKLIVPLCSENQPCYVLYRLDTKNSLGFEWLFISWSPDTSPIREKMLYASTKATLKQEFGNSHIKEEIHGNVLNDITLEGYKKFKQDLIAPAPLTSREEELQEIKRTEVHTEYSLNTKHQVSGLAFPITDSAAQAIRDMERGTYDYLQFAIDTEKEEIYLVGAENFPLEKLPSKIPENNARYHLYKFKHTHEGDYLESFVFVYSMPGYNCSIRERMLYSSCKNPLTDMINNLNLEITKKLEIDSGSELTEKFLYEEIHPTKNLHRPKFAKPKGPPGRGPKRMTKTQHNTDG